MKLQKLEKSEVWKHKGCSVLIYFRHIDEYATGRIEVDNNEAFLNIRATWITTGNPKELDEKGEIYLIKE